MANVQVRAAVFFSALLFFASVLPLPPSSYANEQNGTLELARNHASTREELLLFYEEKDLFVATKRPTSLKKAPAIATVITAEEIRNMGARNLRDVLKTVPGFGVSINEFGRYIFEVRGIRTATSEKILLMMDGHRLNESYTGSALANVYSELPVDNIKQLEIMRGPGSALYGANAFVAVINVVTKDAADIGWTAVKAGAGMQNTYTGGVLAGDSIGKLDLMGSVDYYTTDGQRLLVEADRLAGQPSSMTPGRTNMGAENADVFLKANYGDLSIRGQYSDRSRDAYIGNASALTDDNNINYDNFWTEARYEKSFSGTLTAAVRLYVDLFRQDASVELFPEGFGTFSEGMVAQAQLKNRTLGSELQLGYGLFEGNHLILGAGYEHVRQFDVKQFTNYDPLTFANLGSVQDTSSTNFNKDVARGISAAYLQDEWAVRENVDLTVGVRYDHYSDFGEAVSPRAGIVWTVNDKAEFKLLYGQAFRAPNFVELYNANNPTVVGNPGLKPEHIRTYEAGTGYRFSDRFWASANLFYSEIDDLILRDTSASPVKYANLGGADVRGIETELLGRYSLNDYWKLSYAYQEPKDADTGDRLPDVPSHKAAASINCGISRHLTASTGILWTGARPRGTGDTRGKSPSYTTVDAALTARDFIKGVEVQAAVYNLFDRKYKDPDPSGLVASDFPRERFSALLTATYRF